MKKNKLIIDTIIFDLEGVIIDTEIIWDKEQEEFLKRRGHSYDRDYIKHKMSGRTLYEGVQVLKEELGFSGDLKKLTRERFDIAKEIIQKEVKFIDGFKDFFNSIRNKYKTCIATSLDAELLKIVDKKLSLSDLFKDKMYSVSTVKCKSKPFPDIFLYAAKELNSDPENCIVIEDSPYGITAAKRARMNCIGITTTYKKELLKEADFIISAFSEIDFL